MDPTLNLRPGKAPDFVVIDHLLDLTFGLTRRTKTSYRLREGNEPVPDLFLVVPDEADGLAAAISYWPIEIGDNRSLAILLGPLVVHPAHQMRGLGTFLTIETLARAKALGHELILLMGNAPFYNRFGFEMVPAGQIDVPGPVDPKRLLYLELVPGALSKFEGLALPPWRWSEIKAFDDLSK